ncbi:MAG: MoaD/ThiS family protein [Thermoanaerobaculia bacterium]|nr:MoaD/ThiS family protein [Thermoanaerobaculia bacterium]
MATVILPSHLARQTGVDDRLEATGATIGEALRSLERQQPALRGWVLDERGRIREHVKVFRNRIDAGLEEPLAPDDELHVVQAISGGSGDPLELLVGTRKGLFVLRGERGGAMQVAHRDFVGQTVEYAVRDPRSGRCFASVTHGQYGPRLFLADDAAGPWRQAGGPLFPEDAEAAVSRIWIVRPGAEEGELWAGVAPAALFHSRDDGESWTLNRGLWDQPTRSEWEGGLGGLALHSICPWPGDPRRVAVGISAVGVWITEDGGATWRNHHAGLVPRYLPEEAREGTLMHCVHKMERSPVEPETLYMQFHGGVYRSDDGGASWTDIGTDTGLPADFGFPLVVDPEDADRAWVIPLVADFDRVTPEGRLRVYETRDRGATWRPRSAGLPQENAWATILRQAFCHDGRSPLGLCFGTEQGAVYVSGDRGESWAAAVEGLPPVVAVQAA